MLDAWGVGELVCIGLVFVGVVGEALPEFHLPKKDRPQLVVRRISLLILILGLAGEFLTTMKTSQITGQLIAAVNNEAASATQQTAQLTQHNLQLQSELEDERSARLKVEMRLAPRTLNLQQSGDITRALLQFKGQQVRVVSGPGDFEAGFFAQQLADAIQKAGLKVDSEIGNTVMSGPPKKGIWVYFDNSELPLVKTLAKVMVVSKASSENINGVPSPGSQSVMIFIGQKP
jgi:hypothetical protein